MGVPPGANWESRSCLSTTLFSHDPLQRFAEVLTPSPESPSRGDQGSIFVTTAVTARGLGYVSRYAPAQFLVGRKEDPLVDAIQRTILFLIADTGAGHRSAANAIKNAI